MWQPQKKAWASGRREGGVPLPFSLPLDPPPSWTPVRGGKLETYNPGQTSLGQYCNIHIFLSFLGSLLKRCSLSENFLQFSLLPPYTTLKLKKILDTRVQHCLWGEGRGWTCVNWKTPQKCKSVPRLLSMIVALGTRRTTNNKPSQSVIVFFCSTDHQFFSPLHKFCCKSFTSSSQFFGNIRWLQKKRSFSWLCALTNKSD